MVGRVSVDLDARAVALDHDTAARAGVDRPDEGEAVDAEPVRGGRCHGDGHGRTVLAGPGRHLVRQGDGAGRARRTGAVPADGDAIHAPDDARDVDGAALGRGSGDVRGGDGDGGGEGRLDLGRCRLCRRKVGIERGLDGGDIGLDVRRCHCCACRL